MMTRFVCIHLYFVAIFRLIGSRSRSFQRGIDKAPTFPLSPPKGGSEIPLSNFANRSNSCIARHGLFAIAELLVSVLNELYVSHHA